MEGVANTFLTVGLVCTYIKQIFDSEEMLHNITVLGEVSNLKVVGAYVYFNLKDKDGILPCVCFGLQRNEIPKDGDKIFASGSISFYQKGGKLSFIVSKIYYAGLGELMLYYQEVKEKLEKEGLFDNVHKKEIPKFPTKVCVVTSKTGAVIRDIVTTIRNKNESIDITVVDTSVQGENAVREIINGLSVADKIGADVVILARGGGSWEDLLPFCNEFVARAVYAMETPIISAVGHETDTTLVDFVSDLRVATPTAAGELVTYSVSDQKKYIFGLLKDLKNRVENKFYDLEDKLKNANSFVCLKAENSYNKALLELKFNLNKMNLNLDRILDKKENKFSSLIDKINLLNPLSTLKKGLFKVSSNGKIVTSKEMVSVNDKIELESMDFTIRATVNDVVSKKEQV